MDRSQGFFPRKKVGISTTVLKCRRCGLIFSNPQPVPFDLQDHYGVPPENYWKEDYFKVADDYFSDAIERFKQLVPFRPGMHALDIGAGLGKAMVAMERAGFETYGFEPSKPFHEQAIKRMGIAEDRLRVGDMEHIEYELDQFQFITFGAVLEHLYDPSGSIEKAMRWLAPGGVMHIEVPSSRWLVNRFINAVYRIQGLDYVGNISPMHQPYHLYEFDIKSFTENGTRSGYVVVDTRYDVCQTYMPRFMDPLLKWYMHRTNTGMQLTVWLRKG